MKRLHAAIGGLVVGPLVIFSIAFGAPKILSSAPSVVEPAQAVAEPQLVAAPPADVDRTAVKPTVHRKLQEPLPPAVALLEVPPVAVANLPAALATVASPCERYLRPVSVPMSEGVLDRLLDDRTERVVAEQKKQSRRARDCYRAERGTDGR